MLAIDTNVLVYAHRREAAEHDTAAAQLKVLVLKVRNSFEAPLRRHRH
jgi:predicted nucleic acid-binding protein